MTDPLTESPAIGSPESPSRSLHNVTSRLFGSWRTAGILFPFLAIFIILSITSGPFLDKTNLLNILDQQSSLLIIAAAGTLVLVAGGLDLSVGATYGLASVVSAQLAQHHSPVIAVGAGLLVGLGIGLLNGIIVTIFRINALIATLAMSFVIGGVATLVTSGNLIVLSPQSGFDKVAISSFLGVIECRVDHARRGAHAGHPSLTNHLRSLRRCFGWQPGRGEARRRTRQASTNHHVHPERRRRRARRHHRHGESAERRVLGRWQRARLHGTGWHRCRRYVNFWW